MINASINKTTFSTDDKIEIVLDFSKKLDFLNDASTLTIHIVKLGIERNNLALGFECSIKSKNGVIQVSKKLPITFKQGLYVVSGLRLLYGEKGTEPKRVPLVNHNALFFWFSNEGALSQKQLFQKIRKLNVLRHRYINTEIVTSSVMDKAPARRYKTLIFGMGCLLHSSQMMKGYTLHPLGHGYSYDHMLESVNKFTHRKYGFNIDKVDSIQTSFGASTPLFVIEFQNIRAIDHDDAAAYCSDFAENIFTVLAYERGQQPNSFATLIIDHATKQSWQTFHFPGFRAHTTEAFCPSSTSGNLARLVPKLEKSPWINLMMRLCSDAKNERNYFFACLKLWSIIEMISQRHVREHSIKLKTPCGDFLVDDGGHIVTTNSALGKVYKYVHDKKAFSSCHRRSNGNTIIFETSDDATKNPSYDGHTLVVTLWDTLSSLYVIRNATALSGAFDIEIAKAGSQREKKAAALWAIERHLFFKYVRTLIMSLVSSELNKA